MTTAPASSHELNAARAQLPVVAHERFKIAARPDPAAGDKMIVRPEPVSTKSVDAARSNSACHAEAGRTTNYIEPSNPAESLSGKFAFCRLVDSVNLFDKGFRQSLRQGSVRAKKCSRSRFDSSLHRSSTEDRGQPCLPLHQASNVHGFHYQAGALAAQFVAIEGSVSECICRPTRYGTRGPHRSGAAPSPLPVFRTPSTGNCACGNCVCTIGSHYR